MADDILGENSVQSNHEFKKGNSIKSRAVTLEGLEKAWADRAALRKQRSKNQAADPIKTNQMLQSKPKLDYKVSEAPICRAWNQMQRTLTSTIHSMFSVNKSNNVEINYSIDKPTSILTKKNRSNPNISNHFDIERKNIYKNAANSHSKGNLINRNENQGRNRLASRLDELHKLAAIKAEVEFIRASASFYSSSNDSINDDDKPNHHDEIKNNTQSFKPISILPSDYSFSSALSDLANSEHHKRAFLLLDLASVVSAHVTFHSIISGSGIYHRSKSFNTMRTQVKRKQPSVNRAALPLLQSQIECDTNNLDQQRRKTQPLHIFMEPQFDVQKNRDLELLRLFLRMKVGLRCSSRDDILAVRKAIHLESSNERLLIKNENKDTIENAPDESINEMEGLLLDDSRRIRKPDGYFKTMFSFDSQSHMNIKRSFLNNKEITIDGPDEIHRLVRVVHRFCDREKRRQKSNVCDSNPLKLPETIRARNEFVVQKFVLRLPRSDCDLNKQTFKSLLSKWEILIQNTSTAAQKNGSDLIGISIDLSFLDFSFEVDDLTLEITKNGKETRHLCNHWIQICQFLRRVRLLFICQMKQPDVRFDFTGLPHPLTKDKAQVFTTALATYTNKALEIDEIHDFYAQLKAKTNSTLENDSPLIIDESLRQYLERDDCVVRFTADMSQHLVAHAGALCTRIIGVKKNHNTNDKDGKKARSSTSVDVHYFIDDGCYGSLSQSNVIEAPNNCKIASNCSNKDGLEESESSTIKNDKKFLPLPLYGEKRLILDSPKKLTDDVNQTKSIAKLVNATVWGPTCDGLDRVCSAVLLPNNLEANRDWLIFPNLGCGGFGGGLGLGTAFNGFDPPETAYCVLGYFKDWRSELKDGITSSTSTSSFHFYDD